MKKARLTILVFGLTLGLGLDGLSWADPMGTGFTYQGRLTDEGGPADGEYDFEFELYDDPDAGSQVDGTVIVGDIEVTNGLFTVQLDFGGDSFTGDARWLEIGVRSGDSTGAYTLLSPRQELTPAPYAQTATSVPGGITGSGSAGRISKFTGSNTVGDSVIYEDGTGNVGIGTSNPGRKLDVAGEAEIDGALFARDSTGIGLKDDAGNLGLWVEDGGNVGIGTTNPSAKLDVSGTAKASDFECTGCIDGGDIDSAQVQRRVGGTCSAGNAIRSISEDGTVTCEADDVDDDVASCSNVDSCNYTGSIRHFQWRGSVRGTDDIYDNGYVKIQRINSWTAYRLYCGHSSGCTYVYYVNGARTGGTLSNGGTVDIDMGGDGSDARFLFAKRMNGMDMLVCDVINTNYPYMHFICHDQH